MRMLAKRGLTLSEKLLEFGTPSVETCPGGAQDVWDIPRKQHDLEGLRNGLRGQGIAGVRDDANDHELDAVSCADAAQQFLAGKGMMLGEETSILMPSSQ